MIPFIRSPREKWEHDHNAALCSPRAIEGTIVFLIQGWINYAYHYEAIYKKTVTKDSRLSLSWVLIGRNIQIFLLMGPCGRLDTETLSALVGNKLREHGFSEE